MLALLRRGAQGPHGHSPRSSQPPVLRRAPQWGPLAPGRAPTLLTLLPGLSSARAAAAPRRARGGARWEAGAAEFKCGSRRPGGRAARQVPPGGEASGKLGGRVGEALGSAPARARALRALGAGPAGRRGRGRRAPRSGPRPLPREAARGRPGLSPRGLGGSGSATPPALPAPGLGRCGGSGAVARRGPGLGARRRGRPDGAAAAPPGRAGAGRAGRSFAAGRARGERRGAGRGGRLAAPGAGGDGPARRPPESRGPQSWRPAGRRRGGIALPAGADQPARPVRALRPLPCCTFLFLFCPFMFFSSRFCPSPFFSYLSLPLTVKEEMPAALWGSEVI